MHRLFDKYHYSTVKHRVHDLFKHSDIDIKLYGITPSMLQEIKMSEDDLTSAHKEAIVNLIQNHNFQPLDALEEIKNLSDIQAWTLSELYEIGIRGNHIRVWHSSPLDTEDNSFCIEHKDAIEELIIRYKVSPSAAIKEINRLNTKQVEILLELYDKDFTNTHILNLSPNFIKYLKICYKHLSAFYEENSNKFSPDYLSCINDIMDFYLILKLKDKHKKLGIQTDFISSLKIYLGYIRALAHQMNQDKINSVTYSSEQKNNYSIFFIEEFNKEIHRDVKQFSDFQLGLNAVKELLEPGIHEGSKTITYSLSKQMISHLIALKPKTLLQGRTKLIAEFINANHSLSSDQQKLENSHAPMF